MAELIHRPCVVRPRSALDVTAFNVVLSARHGNSCSSGSRRTHACTCAHPRRDGDGDPNTCLWYGCDCEEHKYRIKLPRTSNYSQRRWEYSEPRRNTGFDPSGSLSDEFKDLINRMLDKDADQRIFAKEALDHAWWSAPLGASLAGCSDASAAANPAWGDEGKSCVHHELCEAIALSMSQTRGQKQPKPK